MSMEEENYFDIELLKRKSMLFKTINFAGYLVIGLGFSFVNIYLCILGVIISMTVSIFTVDNEASLLLYDKMYTNASTVVFKLDEEEYAVLLHSKGISTANKTLADSLLTINEKYSDVAQEYSSLADKYNFLAVCINEIGKQVSDSKEGTDIKSLIPELELIKKELQIFDRE